MDSSVEDLVRNHLGIPNTYTSTDPTRICDMLECKKRMARWNQVYIVHTYKWLGSCCTVGTVWKDLLPLGYFLNRSEPQDRHCGDGVQSAKKCVSSHRSRGQRSVEIFGRRQSIEALQSYHAHLAGKMCLKSLRDGSQDLVAQSVEQ